jgi:HK97 gp10 family phage protein
MANSAQTERLLERYRAIPIAVRNAIRPAMEKSADELVTAMKALAPVDTGALRNSIGWTWGVAPNGSVALDTVAGDADDFRITIYAGSKEAFYARWQEFGTVDQPAHPFFFPAYRLLKQRIKNRIARAVRQAIKDAMAGKL